MNKCVQSWEEFWEQLMALPFTVMIKKPKTKQRQTLWLPFQSHSSLLLWSTICPTEQNTTALQIQHQLDINVKSLVSTMNLTISMTTIIAEMDD